ncbi:hypothetical protein IEN91_04960 [Bacillus velezensis]|nr:hypothetical protein IEN91_04960 [Bacillus velezensis]
MNYKNSYGKTVSVNVERDLDGNLINQNLKHVVSFYIDNDAEVVGIYPLEAGGYTKEDILSIQPVKHEVYAKDLTMEY